MCALRAHISQIHINLPLDKTVIIRAHINKIYINLPLDKTVIIIYDLVILFLNWQKFLKWKKKK